MCIVAGYYLLLACRGFWALGCSPTFKALKRRLKVMYDMLFTMCQRAGVTHPSFLPIGLGAFLPRIQAPTVILSSNSEFKAVAPP
jgi:hypothetical protein